MPRNRKMTRVYRPLERQINVDRCRDDRHDDPDPSYARFPTDGLFHSTTGDTDSSNDPVLRSDRAAFPRPRGCAHHFSAPLYPIFLPPSRPHVGTFLYRRQRAPVVLLQKSQALPPLSRSRPSSQFVDSSFLLSFRWRLTVATMRPQRSTVAQFPCPGNPPRASADFRSPCVHFSIQYIPY